MSTSSPTAFIASHRTFGSALVRRYVESSRRLMVPSSMTLPCTSHQGVYSTWPIAHFVTSRVTMRSSSRAASATADQVLVERRDVEQRGGVADRGVFAVGMRVVRARDLVAGPAAPGLSADERSRAGVERRRFQHAAKLSLGQYADVDELNCGTASSAAAAPDRRS